MEAGRASETARFVAIQRAHHHLFAPEPHLLDDTLALPISGLPNEAAVKAAIEGLVAGFAQLGGEDVAREFVRQVEHAVCARSRFVEERLEQGEFAQLVMLGAGLDTLPYRGRELLAGVDVFEVDHPDTQAAKRAALDNAGIAVPGNVRFVPFDFENTTLADALDAGGLDRGKRTLFAWLGVNMYLTDEAVRATARAMAGFAPGSEAVMDFVPTESTELDGAVEDSITELRKMVESMGEPIRSRFSIESLEAVLTECGFARVKHLSGRMIRDRFLGGQDDAYSMPDEAVHIVAAIV